MDEKQHSQDISETIRAVVFSCLPDGQIFLFGSRANGDHNVDSDYDVLILSQKVLSAGDKMPLKTQIRKALLTKGIRSDIVIQNIEEAERNRLLPGHFIRRILNNAILL